MRTLKIMKDDRLRLLYDAVDDLGDKVGTTKWKLPVDPELDKRFPVKLFGQTPTLGAKASAGLLIHPSTHTVDVFGTGESLPARPGHSFAELHLRGGFGVSVNGKLTSVPLQPKLRVAAGGELRYNHLLTVSRDTKRIDALKNVVARGQLWPATVELRKIQPGESHVYAAWLNVDVGLTATFGKSFDFEELLEPFDDLDVAVKAHIDLTAKAGLGWSIYREMKIVVAASQANPGWVRVRIERENRRRFSAGASVDLKVEYDLAQPLEAIFDYALELDATVEVFDALQKVDSLFRQDGWPKVREKLSERLGEALMELVDDTGWREWLGNSPEARRLIELATSAVASYDKLDRRVAERVRALWADVLDFTQLQSDSKLRLAIEKLAGLDATNLDLEQLLGEQGGRVVELLETLSGENLEELLLSDRRENALKMVKKAAQGILDLADGVPSDLLQRFDELKKKSRIDGVVAFLRKNASSKAALEQAIDTAVRPRVRRLGERLIGKAWSALDEDDIAKLQHWADRMSKFLAHRTEWEERIRNEIARLRGSFGFSLSLEFERVTETTAILDIEANPRDKSTVRALRMGLQSGDVSSLLAALPQGDDDDDTHELTWYVREGLLTSRRLRSGAVTLLSSLTGRTTRKSERIQETEVRIDGKKRTARYAAGFVRSLERSAGQTSTQAAAWWVASATGRGVNPTKPYDEISDQLQVKLLRVDGKTEPHELRRLDDLLLTFGFGAANRRPIETAVMERLAKEATEDGGHLPSGTPLPSQLDARFSVELRLPQDAVDELLIVNDEADWDIDYLNAAHRWYEEPLIERSLSQRPDVRKGDVLAAILRSGPFRKQWTNSLLQFSASLGDWSHIQVNLPHKHLSVVLAQRVGPRSRWMLKPDFVSLGELVRKRGRGLRRMLEAETAHRDAVTQASPALLEVAVRKIARALRASAAVSQWPNPAFLPWLALARASDKPEVLAEAAGVASFRWRFDESEKYRVHVWSLENGIADLKEGGVFPIRD